MYGCVNISLTTDALKHVHLEDEFVQNQLLIDVVNFSYIPVAQFSHTVYGICP